MMVVKGRPGPQVGVEEVGEEARVFLFDQLLSGCEIRLGRKVPSGTWNVELREAIATKQPGLPSLTNNVLLFLLAAK